MSSFINAFATLLHVQFAALQLYCKMCFMNQQVQFLFTTYKCHNLHLHIIQIMAV